MKLSALPTLNVLLNSLTVVLLTTGYVFIRRQQINAHRACMLAAFGTSTIFLISYLIYHFNVGSVAFTGHGTVRTVYFAILISHVILSILILPLAIATLTQAFRGRFDRHRRIARWTLPLWLYVSVTGVIVYLMLYQM